MFISKNTLSRHQPTNPDLGSVSTTSVQNKQPPAPNASNQNNQSTQTGVKKFSSPNERKQDIQQPKTLVFGDKPASSWPENRIQKLVETWRHKGTSTVPSLYRRDRCCHQASRQGMSKTARYPRCPPQRISDLENTTRQLRQLTCILDSCTISASCEVSQAQKALLLMPRTAKGASTSSEELNAQMSPLTDDEFHVFRDQDQLQEHFVHPQRRPIPKH